MTRLLRIGKSLIRDESDCFVIAEIGHNHQGDLGKARELVKSARDCGCSAAKLQKRDNASLFTRDMFVKPYPGPNSFGDTYGKHREFLEFDQRQYVALQEYSRELGIIFFSTAFDFASVDFLEELDVDAYKLASGDVTNTELQKHCARTGKPIILSTGTADLEDVQRAYDTIMPLNRNLAILQCTASYPTSPADLNLNVITTFRNRFPDIVIGASLHDLGTSSAVAAYALGARIIEKHFTLSRASKGTDHAFSLEPEAMKSMVEDLRTMRLALGDGAKRSLTCESSAKSKMGKSIYAATPLLAGTRLGAEHIAFKSPGGFLAPFQVSEILGRVLTKPLQADEPILREHLHGNGA